MITYLLITLYTRLNLTLHLAPALSVNTHQDLALCLFMWLYTKYIIFNVLPSFIHLLFGNSAFGKPHINIICAPVNVHYVCRIELYDSHYTTPHAMLGYWERPFLFTCLGFFFHIYVEKVKLLNLKKKRV